jgi:pimeloyl-ACP methyl ester carboxylesterase
MSRRTILSVCLLGVLILVLAAVGVALSRKSTARAAVGDDARPGLLAKLPDGRRINLRCSGSGAPTVLLESGFGGDSRAWGAVRQQVSRTTQVCAYDRAGYGYSDPAPLPRDGAAIARDLDQALQAANIGGPYVVVGHSAGGLYARLFAARRLRDVVGLIFVDSSVEYQQQRLAALFGPGPGGLQGVRKRPARCLEATQAPSTGANAADRAGCIPPNADPQTRLVYSRPATWSSQLSELDTLFASTSDEVARVGDLTADIPVIVLTASPDPDGTPAYKEDLSALAWQTLHAQLAASFRFSEQRIVKSSHLMMVDRPEMVSAAALDLVKRARARP